MCVNHYVWGVMDRDDPFNPEFIPVGSYDDTVLHAREWGIPDGDIVKHVSHRPTYDRTDGRPVRPVHPR